MWGVCMCIYNAKIHEHITLKSIGFQIMVILGRGRPRDRIEDE